MNIYIAQINPTIGDLSGNFLLAQQAVQAAGDEVDLVVFPELSVCGYSPNDLLNRPAFTQEVETYSLKWVKLSESGPAILFGTVNCNTSENSYQNVAILCQNGNICGIRAKSLLPTYDVFSEDRYFTPATSVSPMILNGTKLGVCICEDIWNDKEFWDEPMYPRDPIETLCSHGVDIIINLSASPFSEGKQSVRMDMLSHTARRFNAALIYVNQVGGNDEVIYDGRSMVFDSKGDLRFGLRGFVEDGAFVTISPAGEIVDFSPRKLAAELIGSDMRDMHQALILGLKDYAKKCNFKKVLLGLSGGIDSAVVAALAVEAFGANNVLGIAMPSKYSSSSSVLDAHTLADNLGMQFKVHPINDMYDAFFKELGPKDQGAPEDVDLALENLQARIRGAVLMTYSNRDGRLLLSTGNKSEVAIGYCTIYGDTCGGLAVISDVYKTKVYALAQYLNERIFKLGKGIPNGTMTKPPSAELRPGQIDTDSLPDYGLLDSILKMYIEDQSAVDEIVGSLGHEDVVRKMCRLVDRNEYKRRQLAPGLRVTKKAFGCGRLMPIAQGWGG